MRGLADFLEVIHHESVAVALPCGWWMPDISHPAQLGCRIVLLLMGLLALRSPGKSQSLWPVRSRNISSTSNACLASGTVCGVRIFIRSGGYIPTTGLQVEFCPLGSNQFAGADERERHQLDRQPGYVCSLIDLDVPQQCWQLPGVYAE